MEKQQHRQPKQLRTRRAFTTEFKRDAVELVRTTGHPIAHIARDLGIYDSTLGNWVRQDAIDRGEQDGLTTQERARLHPAGTRQRKASDGA
jgi:transposase